VVSYLVNDSPGPASDTEIPWTEGNPTTIDGHPVTGTYGGGIFPPPGFSNFVLGGENVGFVIGGSHVSSAWTQHSGSLALNYELSPATNAEIFYAGSSSVINNLPPLADAFFAPPPGYTGGLAVGMFEGDLSGGRYANIPFTQGSSLLEEKITTKLGSGVLRLAALQNRSFSTCFFSQNTSADLPLFGGAYLNGSPTPTVYNGTYHDVTFSPSTVNEAFGSFNRDLLLSYATPLGENFHAGVSFVKSYYDMPGYYNNYGYGSTPTDLDQYSYYYPSDESEATNELRVFVGGNLSDKTTLDLSGYFVNADYHILDGTTATSYTNDRFTYAAPRLGFVWRPTAAIALRASAGGGFAEIPLGDLASSIYNLTGALSSASTPTIYPCPAFPLYYTETPINHNLQPEKSFALDVGTDIRLHRDTILSFDLYHANLYGQFYQTTNSLGTYTGPYGTLPLYEIHYGNLGESRYEGLVVDVQHDVPHGVYWSLSGGLTRGYVVSVPPGFYNGAGCTNCSNLQVVPGINFNGSFTTVNVPYASGSGKFGYRWNPDKYVDLSTVYYGNNNTYVHPAFFVFNGEVGYPLRKNISLLMSFRNITGVYDNTRLVYSAASYSGVPSLIGAPFGLLQEPYGPRTAILTANVRF